ncbi:hypothetical protein VPH35_018722 [Triticum aestivum]
MDHMMHLHQHHQLQCGNQRDAERATSTRSSGSASVSQVAFVLAAVAFLSLFSSSSFGAAAIRPSSSSSLPSGAALSARLAALCGFVTTKKALFVLSNAIFLFLAADCRCFFPGASSTASELPPCAVQAQACASYQWSLCYSSNTKGASASCSGEQWAKREEVPVSSRFEPAGLEEDDANIVALETEQTCGGGEELEMLEIEELNRKFEDFIQSRRIKWLKEEEQVLQCQQQVV